MPENATPLISVILPVYRVEKYLGQCLDSLLAQTYRNLELILVDDGSPDNSGEICDEYARKDERIKVLHCENRGVSVARNTGLAHASGELVSFIDPDDYLDATFYEYLFSIQSKTASDIAYCSFRKVDEEGSLISSPADNWNKIETFERKNAVVNCLTAKKDFQMYIWNGLFKKKIVPQFIEGRRIGQDQDFTVKALLNAETVSRGWGVKYNYRIRKTSSRSVDLRQRMKYQYLALGDIRRHLEAFGMDAELEMAYYNRCFRMDLGLMDRYSTANEKDTQLFKDLRSNLIDHCRKAYPGLGGFALSTILRAGESGYRAAFRLIKKIQK